MASCGTTSGDDVELAERPRTTSCPSLSSNTPQKPSQLHDSEYEDAESDADDVVFHDAVETLTAPQERPSFSPARALYFFKSKKSSLGKWVRVSYAAVMVVGMTVGLVFTYLQWRQQALANELSKIQACTQTVDASLSSSLCSNLHQPGESSPISPRNDYRDSFALLLPARTVWPHSLWYFLGAVLIAALLFVTRLMSVTRRELSMSANSTTEDESLTSTLHVSYHIPRSTLLSFEALSIPLEFLTPNLHGLLTLVWEGTVKQTEYVKVSDSLPDKAQLQESMLRHVRHLKLGWWGLKSIQNMAPTTINSDMQTQGVNPNDDLGDTDYNSVSEYSDLDAWLPLESRVSELQDDDQVDDDQQDDEQNDASEDGHFDPDAELHYEAAKSGIDKSIPNTLESSKNDLMGLFEHILRLQNLEQTQMASTQNPDQKEIVRIPWHSSVFSNFQATEAFRVRSHAQSTTSDDSSTDPPKGRDYRFLDVPLPRNAFVSPGTYLCESDDEEVVDEWLPTARSMDAAEALLARNDHPEEADGVDPDRNESIVNDIGHRLPPELDLLLD